MSFSAEIIRTTTNITKRFKKELRHSKPVREEVI